MYVSKLKIRFNLFISLIIFLALMTIAAEKLSASVSNTSTWELIGQMDAFHDIPSDPFAMAVDAKSGEPYVAYYTSNPKGFFLSVAKYDSKSNKWLAIDQFLLPLNGTFSTPSLAISPLDSTVYVSYQNGGMNRIRVMKYDAVSEQWSDISKNIPDSPFSELKLDQSGNPYIIYSDFLRSPNSIALARYDAQKNLWTKVGNEIRTNSMLEFATMAITKTGKLYVAYNTDRELTVMTFNGKSWEKVGSSQTIGYPPFRLVVDNSDTLYLAYSASGYASVMKLEDSQWTFVGQPFSPTTNGISSIDLIFDQNNIPYISFSAFGAEQAEVWVMTYDNNKKTWLSADSPIGKTGLSFWTHLGVSATNKLYVAYAEHSADLKINVMSRDI